MVNKLKHKCDWFSEKRFGLFVHWGPYAVAARGEWVMNRERIPVKEYTENYVNKWHAENYDPAEWARLAKDAGMGYLVLTARHHDGFALWDSAFSDFTAAKLGPKRDLVAPYVEATRKAGLKVGLYYSPASWTHPDYPGPFFRDWPSVNDWVDESARRSFIEFYRGQLKELLTRYGKIDYFWFDGCVPDNIEGNETLAIVRKLQPEIMVNNRLGEPYDVLCCEQTIKPASHGQVWEACMTLNDNWGYHAGDCNWKQPCHVMQMLLQCAESGGNLLLNIGPKADGSVPEESVRILRKTGELLKRNREAVSCSERHQFSWNSTARPITARGNMIYLHFLKEPFGSFCWAEVKSKVKSVRFLADGSPIAFHQDGNRLFLRELPVPLPDTPLTTIAVELEPESVT